MNKEMISVTDELLMDLYKIEWKSLYLEHIVLNGEDYLINKRGVLNKYEIGIYAKIPSDLLERYSIDEIIDSCTNNKCGFGLLRSRLVFVPKEIFIMNILLSHYLNTDSRLQPEISFKDLDYYRKKGAYGGISVPEANAESYCTIINSLKCKQLYLKTSPSFRKRTKKDYGVSDRNLYQDLLTIYDPIEVSSTNMSFKYSFGEFGIILKNCRRWSNLVPNRCFQYCMSQAINNLIATEIARQIYVSRYCSRNSEFNVDFSYFFESIEGETCKNRRRRERRFCRNVNEILNLFKKEDKIDDFVILGDKKNELMKATIYIWSKS